ncbi:related to imidazolonepropionase and related amidohydrolases [Ramularia collo-cygni]|uniref:Related to imidazolonepropionase and related amidohydrolases n=1 Tax=Ramularia collo-cygni TaxID=112498 RepID=A0A2D3UPE4_9PEZI|nr:related to imidazolonepropionase and related amidohydrolases [Ramularia collo-cygni]CZT18352.1 related to imidazolonepropionase and related amidohydrolases [Ramularia collo-cygni]
MVDQAQVKPWLRPALKSYILTNANIVNVVDGSTRSKAAVRVQNGLIEKIVDSTTSVIEEAQHQGFQIIDCKNGFICPGLIDAHVHIMAVPGFQDISSAFGNPNDVSVLRQPYVCAQMLYRGFTTVRDCGGALLALKEAINDGVFPGPRLFIAGHALSQSGGHADFRGAHDSSFCSCGDLTGLGRVCNGVAGCMQAVREEIRTGVDFIKIMGSGGVSSPTDKIDHLQFTGAEIRAMVECAANAGTYVTAHAYTSKAIRHCIDNGARGIEHGNFLDVPTAKLMAELGCYLTPTLVTYSEMASKKWAGFLTQDLAVKNAQVLESGLQALKIASDNNVTICYGSDLLGPLDFTERYHQSCTYGRTGEVAGANSAWF